MALTETEATQLADIVDVLTPITESLRGRERLFVEEQLQKYEELGSMMYLSRKQWNWLQDIVSRFS